MAKILADSPSCGGMVGKIVGHSDGSTRTAPARRKGKPSARSGRIRWRGGGRSIRHWTDLARRGFALPARHGRVSPSPARRPCPPAGGGCLAGAGSAAPAQSSPRLLRRRRPLRFPGTGHRQRLRPAGPPLRVSDPTALRHRGPRQDKMVTGSVPPATNARDGGYLRAMTSNPASMRAAPATVRAVIRSLRMKNASRTATTTLALSMSATVETSPSLIAL